MARTRDAIDLPVLLDRVNLGELGPRLERAGAGAVVVLDGSLVQQIETTGVQLLCALVLRAEGRGATVRWTGISDSLIKSVKLLGIGDVIRFDRAGPVGRESGH